MINDTTLKELTETLSALISPKRFRHTLAVADMVGRLCDLYCPDDKLELTAAGLLHDVTKEKTTEEQIALCRRYGIAVNDEDIASPKTFHARTAVGVIREHYPNFATPTVLSAVKYHTTGRKGMKLHEKLLYLADYIDDTRTYDNCVALRRAFWDAHPEKMTDDERLVHLDRILLTSLDMTVRDLLDEGKLICADTLECRNALILRLTEINYGN